MRETRNDFVKAHTRPEITSSTIRRHMQAERVSNQSILTFCNDMELGKKIKSH